MKSNQIKISIIIPMYGVEQYIEQCLLSVINQSLLNIEIIAVNDCSPDKSFDILKPYSLKDPRIKLVSTPKNLGLSGARNFGMKFASGDYIHFLDGDDYISNAGYSNLYDYGINNALDLIIFSYYKVKESTLSNDISTPHLIENSLKTNDGVFFKSDESKLSLLKSKPGIVVWNKLYKRSLILDNKLHFYEGLLYEDIPWFWQTVISASNIGFFNQPLYFYRKRSDSIMANLGSKGALDFITSMDLSYKYILSSNKLELFGKNFFKKMLKTYSRTLTKLTTEQQTKFIQKMQNSLKGMSFKNANLNFLLYLKCSIYLKISNYRLLILLIRLKIL